MNSEKYRSTPEYIFNNPEYRDYLIKYTGDPTGYSNSVDGVYVTPLDNNYAILSIRINLQSNIFDYSIVSKYKNEQGETLMSNILYIKYPEFYKLQDISPIEAAEVRVVQTDTPLNVTGKKVVVGIIDTGIDYLSNEFMTLSGETRINFIWDQTIANENNLPLEVPYGTEYDSEKINNAIQLFREGKDPYTIVPSVDKIGHGTNMAGIIAATGVNPELKGVAPDCELCIIKLSEAITYKSDLNIEIPIFNITTIVAAIIRLYNYSIKSLKPMVIYLPLGTNSGNHRGNGLINEIIQKVSNSMGIIVVTGSGNEGAEGGHTSGFIPDLGGTETIDLNVSDEQKSLIVEIWADLPNIMTLNIISPSGEDTGIIPVLINSTEKFNFIFEKVSIQVSYLIPEQITGDELILIYFGNLQPGSWKLRLTANAVTDGAFNAWIPVQGISVGDTRFIQADPFGTLTTPGDSPSGMTVAAYNQNNNNTINYSGMAFKNDLNNSIYVAAGAVNAKTIAPGNKIEIVNGTSVSAAVASGVCALIFQWGMTDGNYPSMYAQSLITYMIRGTVKRRGDIYPNYQWGFGILNVFEIFRNMP
ncbi:S8 family peptidase [Clostridium gasigenes]|uniref:S8 family peptidase n=1 Tax=Clostridium gasigenes TaxID=94869 RepID=UPI001C0BFBAE|nr:S8 family peptidase [Clostridium gasigenes]MBU3136344.1 S8 family peptidase [Clostridium gasigenes]